MKTDTAPTVPNWARVTVLAASLALLGAYVLPLWRITLEAPQYPEGLGMLIRVNTIEGIGPNDLNNINNLNHYIGMKRIVPGSIAELRFMPWILGGIIAWGLAAAATGRRWMVCSFFGLLAAAALVGLADFWRWGYDYGHDLDAETAIIKVPGMTYQPPLIGSKKLLNFTAHSWPAAGGWLALAAGLAAAVACVGPRFLRRLRGSGAHVGAALIAAGLVGTAGCGPDRPVPIVVGEDVCDHCVMAIQEPRFAAEAITGRGRVHRFDSIECLAGWVLERSDPDAPLAGTTLWVTDMRAPGDWIRVEEALFLRSPAVPSPMGMHLGAMAAAAPAAERSQIAPGAETLGWEDVLGLVRASGGHAGMHGGPGTRDAVHGAGH
jgi:copper chaperone NosL